MKNFYSLTSPYPKVDIINFHTLLWNVKELWKSILEHFKSIMQTYRDKLLFLFNLHKWIYLFKSIHWIKIFSWFISLSKNFVLMWCCVKEKCDFEFSSNTTCLVQATSKISESKSIELY